MHIVNFNMHLLYSYSSAVNHETDVDEFMCLFL